MVPTPGSGDSGASGEIRASGTGCTGGQAGALAFPDAGPVARVPSFPTRTAAAGRNHLAIETLLVEQAAGPTNQCFCMDNGLIVTLISTSGSCFPEEGTEYLADPRRLWQHQSPAKTTEFSVQAGIDDPQQGRGSETNSARPRPA